LGEPGEYADGYELDEKMARRVPKTAVGRALTQREAQKLLDRLSLRRA
jgi:hypothetical protein